MILNPHTLDAYDLLHKGILALARAEMQGLRIDMDYIEKKKKHLAHKVDTLESSFKQTNFFRHWQHTVKGSININSNLQLSHYLYKIKGIKIEKETTSGLGSTDDEALRQMQIPELNDLLEIRKFKKLQGYLDLFEREQVDGYLHPFFNLHLVSTFRSSSDHPNFQNIPKRDEESMQTCRRALYPRPGHQLMEIDTSGMEVRIAACYHKDTTMLKYITEPTSDLHGDMTQQIFILDKFDKKLPEHYVLRQATKNGFVFPEFYGDYYKNCAIGLVCNWGKLPQGVWKPGQGIAMPEGTLSDHLISKGIRSLDSFTTHLQKIEADFWGKRFKEYADWKETWISLYKKYGYVDLLSGFRCSGVMDRKQVINYPVQGAAFHCLLWSLNHIDEVMVREKWDTKIIGQIHDSILFDCLPEEIPHVVEVVKRVMTKDLLEEWKWIIIPIEIDCEISEIDGSWAEKHSMKI